MRTHGWAGNPPSDDDEAIRRVLDATRLCIDRDGADIGIVDVARELGVTRQTVYRYYRTTEDLLLATALDASAGFLTGIHRHLGARMWTPAEAVVEGIAYTLEQLPKEPYLAMLLTPSRISIFSDGFTSETATAMGRAMIETFPVDWPAHGFTSADLDELVEQMLRMTRSFVEHAGTPPRAGDDLRGYLIRWIAPSVEAVQAARSASGGTGGRGPRR